MGFIMNVTHECQVFCSKSTALPSLLLLALFLSMNSLTSTLMLHKYLNIHPTDEQSHTIFAFLSLTYFV